MPLRKHPVYTGAFVGVEGIALVSSSMLGGVLVEKLSTNALEPISPQIGAFSNSIQCC